MSLSVTARAVAAALSKPEETKTTYRTGLDARIADIGSHIQEQSAVLKEREFKAHFVSNLVEDPAVHALLEKCHMEAASPEAAQAAFQSSMLAHVQAAVGARTYKTDAERQSRIDQTMESLMGQLEPQLRGLKEGAGASASLARICSESNETQKGICTHLAEFIERRIEHRDDRRSTDSGTLAKAFREECKRSTRDDTEPFFELWRSQCVAQGRMVSPEQVTTQLFEELSQQLAGKKGYSPEDANKKAWHIVDELSAPAKAAIASHESYLSGFVFGMNANPAALEALHHETEAAPALHIARATPQELSKNTTLSGTKLKLEHQLQAEQNFQRTFDEFAGLVRANLVKTTVMMRSSYPSTDVVISKVFEAKPDLVKDLIRTYFLQNNRSNSDECRREITGQILGLLQTIDPSYYGGDKGLEKANHFYRDAIAKLETGRVTTFDGIKSLALADQTTWNVEGSLLESYRHAKALAPFIKETPADPPAHIAEPPTPSTATLARKTSVRSDSTSDPDESPREPTVVIQSTPQAHPVTEGAAIRRGPPAPPPLTETEISGRPKLPLDLKSAILNAAKRKEPPQEGATSAAGPESTAAVRSGPPAPPPPPSADQIASTRPSLAEQLASAKLRKTPPKTDETAGEASTGTGKPAPKGFVINPDMLRGAVLRHTTEAADEAIEARPAPKKAGFNPADALKVQLRPRARDDSREQAAPAPTTEGPKYTLRRAEAKAPPNPAEKPLSELEQRLARMRAKEGEPRAGIGDLPTTGDGSAL